MDAMEEDDPALYLSLINYIMEDDSPELGSGSVQWSDPVVGGDEERDDEADDFKLLFLLLRERHAALHPGLFSEGDLLDKDGYPRLGKKTPRGKQRKRDPDSSRFKKYLDVGEAHRDTCDSIWNENTWEGKQFRRRFRLPFAMFDKLCNDYEAVDPRKSTDAFRNPKSNIRLLILGTLRVLGQSLPFDSVEELNDISTDKNNKFFK